MKDDRSISDIVNEVVELTKEMDNKSSKAFQELKKSSENAQRILDKLRKFVNKKEEVIKW